jgi:methylmalonyl-CoA mutase
MYQRGKIQEESLYYETLKHTGELPIVGVNTFLSSAGSPTVVPREVIRATGEEKEAQIESLKRLHRAQAEHASRALGAVQDASVANRNIFTEILEAAKVASLGQITEALFAVGGEYRRSM